MQKCKFAGVSDPESCRRNARLVVVSVVCGRCNICHPMVCGAFVEHLRCLQSVAILFAIICSYLLLFALGLRSVANLLAVS